MNFLMTFFDSKSKRAHHKETEMQKRKERLMLNTSNPRNRLPQSSHKKCQPMPLQKEPAKNICFDFQKAARSIPVKFVEFNTIRSISDISDVQWGELAGVINKTGQITEAIP